MTRYRIFAGLSGGFGGAQYQYTDDFHDLESAEAAAYAAACENFDSQAGCGMDGWEQFMEQAEEEISSDGFTDDEYQQALEEWATEAENEARESWIDYHVIEVGSPRDLEDEDESWFND